jgi:hypothetical protein
MNPNEKAPCAGHAEGLRNTNHKENYLSILPLCKYSANYKHGLLFTGHPIQILLDGSFIAWIDGHVSHADDSEALHNILNNKVNCHD